MTDKEQLCVWLKNDLAHKLDIPWSTKHTEMYVHNTKKLHCYRQIKHEGFHWETCWVDCVVSKSSPGADMHCVGWLCPACNVTVNLSQQGFCVPCHHAWSVRQLKRKTAIL